MSYTVPTAPPNTHRFTTDLLPMEANAGPVDSGRISSWKKAIGSEGQVTGPACNRIVDLGPLPVTYCENPPSTASPGPDSSAQLHESEIVQLVLSSLVSYIWQVCILLVAVIAFLVLATGAMYLLSLVLRPKHVRAIWDLGPPRKIRAQIRVLGQRVEANTEADSERDKQIRALHEQVRELQRRQERLEAIIVNAASGLTHAGGAHGIEPGAD